MSACDAHEAVHGSPKQLAHGEGYLLDAHYMQRSAIQERNIEIGMKTIGVMMEMSRNEYGEQLAATQGSTPWLICKQCMESLFLADGDKNAARQAAIKWWHDKSAPGYKPGNPTVTAQNKPFAKRKWWQFWR